MLVDIIKRHGGVRIFSLLFAILNADKRKCSQKACVKQAKEDGMRKKQFVKIGKFIVFILLMIPAALILALLAGIGALLEAFLRMRKIHNRTHLTDMKLCVKP